MLAAHLCCTGIGERVYVSGPAFTVSCHTSCSHVPRCLLTRAHTCSFPISGLHVPAAQVPALESHLPVLRLCHGVGGAGGVALTFSVAREWVPLWRSVGQARHLCGLEVPTDLIPGGVPMGAGEVVGTIPWGWGGGTQLGE